MKKLKKIFRAGVCCVGAFIMTACSGFDAEGYTRAVLDHMFQGETEALAAYAGEAGNKQLEDEYEDYIAAFSESLTEGLNASEGMEEKFNVLCQEIFRSVRYDVKGAEKKSSEAYSVSVEIEPVDVFVRWKALLEENAGEVSEKAERGEYQGTEEEQIQMMLADITAQSYELLDTAYREASYGDTETVVLTISKDEKGRFVSDDDEISNLVMKILCLDVIQG